LGLSELGGHGLPVLPAVDGCVADTKLPCKVLLAQGELTPHLFHQRREISTLDFYSLILCPNVRPRFYSDIIPLVISYARRIGKIKKYLVRFIFSIDNFGLRKA